MPCGRQAPRAAWLWVGAAPEHASTRAGLHIAAITAPKGTECTIQSRHEAEAAALGQPDLA